MAAGDFTASNMRSALIKADKMWKDDNTKVDYEADVDVVLALQKEQNASVTVLEDTNKDVDVAVHWIDACGIQAQECVDLCTPIGQELSTDKKEYTLDMCREVGFKVSERVFRTNMYSMEDVVAKGLLASSKALDDYFAQQCVAKVDSFVGVNKVTNGRGTVQGTNTYIPEADWTPSIFAYFKRVATRNKYANPFLLSGENLYELAWETAYDRANGEGKGADAKMKSMRKYFDLFNIDTVNEPELVTYLINRGAIAMAFKNEFGAAPKTYNGAGITKSRTASRNIPGVFYDTVYQNSCEGDDIVHQWKFRLKSGLFLNPTGCEDGRTGVLRMVAGTAPSEAAEPQPQPQP